MVATSSPHIGILALQGDFERHATILANLGAKPLLVNKVAGLNSIDGLVIPGGESTTMLKLLGPELQQSLIEVISGGLPTFATCAGVILLAKSVSHPKQESLGLLDTDVERNAYGRQKESFVDPELRWVGDENSEALEGIFIRAPRITRVGERVQTLIERNNEPVFIRQESIFAATFHPELSESASSISQLFLSVC